MASTETPAQRRGERLVVRREMLFERTRTVCLSQFETGRDKPCHMFPAQLGWVPEKARMGGTEPRHDPERARVAILFVVLAIVCVLAGFIVGVVRSGADHSPRPVTVKTTIAVSGSR